MDPYDILDVPHDADAMAIEAAWRLAAKRFHPDVNKHPDAAKKFAAARAAYETLIDPEKRAEIDGVPRPQSDEAIEELALNCIRSRFEHAIEQAQSKNVIDSVDLVSTAKHMILSDIISFGKQQHQAETLVNAYRKLRPKVRGKILERIIERKLGAARRAEVIASDNIRAANRALAILADYRHDRGEESVTRLSWGTY